MIALHRLDHVALRVSDLEEATTRWSRQFGLTVRSSDARHAVLTCDDEPRALELVATGPGEVPGFARVGWELAHDCSLDDAAAHLDAAGVTYSRADAWIDLVDLEGNPQRILAYAEPALRVVAHARGIDPTHPLPVGHPRKLGHVNFLTGRLGEQARFYIDVLGMKLTDNLGNGGSWLHVGPEHHVMALVDKGYSHFHHLAFDVVDIGQMRVALDHLGRHGRWLGWGPVRHGIGGNIASYVRIVEEQCFVELYCDMEILTSHHAPRQYADNRYSSNTWGPLPPRSYFRFDDAAVDSERESLEMQGVPLAPAQEPARA